MAHLPMICPLIGVCACLLAVSFAGAAEPKLPPDEEYVTVKDGHLSLKGKRVRFWGHIGHFPNPDLKNRTGEQCRRDHELMAERLVDLGFNLHRLWHLGTEGKHTRGDNSREDLQEYGYSLLKKHGIKIWFAVLGGRGLVDTEQDVNIIDDPATAEEWKQAIAAMAHTTWRWQGKQTPVKNIAYVWDPRLRALALRNMERVAKHRNPYTGLRYCDDPDIAVWELTNEEWWMPKMVQGQWLKLPRLFQRQLIAKWNAWLAKKYRTDAALKKAWQFLMPGEGLKDATVMLAPTATPASPAQLNDPNPHAQQALSEGAEELGRDQFTRQRASDVIEFFMQMQIEFKASEAKALKSWGKSARLAPLCWDTGTGWQIQCQYLHQHADAVTHCTYVNGKHHDPAHKRFPFNSALEELPRMCWNLPWVEHNKVAGKPFFVYEIQIKNSTKYRTEFPMEVAALGSLQDWDIVNWHSYGPGPDSTKPDPHTRALEVGHSLDLHYGGDEVQLSAMKAAAEVFKNGLVKPAPNPTTFVYGRRMLYDPASMDYSGSYGEVGREMLPTTYRYGMRILIDPDLDRRPDDPLFEQMRQFRFGKPKTDAEQAEQLRQVRQDFARTGCMVIGPSDKRGIFEPCPITPTNQITYDWQRGFLTLDAPGAAVFAGFYGQLADPKGGVAFKASGVVLKDVVVRNPEGMPYPVTEDERYIAFGLASADPGAPGLAKCREAVLSLVSTSFNTGFQLSTSGELREFHGAQTARGKRGGLPVLVARVGATVVCEAIDGMTYTLYDFEMQEIGGGTVRGGVLKVPADKPIFVIRLNR